MLVLLTALAAAAACLAAALCGAQLAAALLRVLAGVLRSCKGTAPCCVSDSFDGRCASCLTCQNAVCAQASGARAP